MFHKAKNVTINDGTFIDEHHSHFNSESGLLKLSQLEARAASYESQSYPPCPSGSREDHGVRAVSEWMFSNHCSKKPILWLNTPPQSSRTFTSSIAQHVAQECAKRGELVASFFFHPTRPKCSSIDHFVHTLVVQLACQVPGFQNGLCKVLNEDPFVIHHAIPRQVGRLILEPLQSVTMDTHGPFLVVIDGLDKCVGEENQREVLAQLARIVRTPQRPLRFVITSASTPSPALLR